MVPARSGPDRLEPGMSTVDYACIFVRASGERLLAAERLVLAFPQLFADALVELDLAYRVPARFLVATLRFSPKAMRFAPALRDRLAFWAARAGGRASPIAAMSEQDLVAFRANFDACELKVKGVTPGNLFEATGRLFSDAGAPAGRRRSVADRPTLAIDVGGPGWEGASYLAEARALFVAAPVAPPVGDELALAVRVPGSDRPVRGTAKVTEVRTAEGAGPGKPAGYTLVVAASPPALHEALAAYAPAHGPRDGRAAPRFAVKAPVKVFALPAGPAPVPPPAAAPARATIEYATDLELQADFVENLSQGGAFVRSAHPPPLGTAVVLELKLPNGADLRADATVVFLNANGMGVKFTLDAESDAVLSAAIAQISARPRRALVVDDDRLVCELLADALGERGFEVLTAHDGDSGLRTLAEELLALDLLVTDVRMPGMDGERFVRTIRTAGGETELAIVAITSRLDEGLEPRLEQAGADAVLDKALGVELIAQAADAVLERKRLAARR
jgi:CheY-like chemotaxis protein